MFQGKGEEIYIQIKWTKKQAGVAILKFSKIDFTEKNNQIIGEVHYIFLKGINATKDGFVIFIIFALNTWLPNFEKETFLKLK